MCDCGHCSAMHTTTRVIGCMEAASRYKAEEAEVDCVKGSL